MTAWLEDCTLIGKSQNRIVGVAAGLIYWSDCRGLARNKRYCRSSRCMRLFYPIPQPFQLFWQQKPCLGSSSFRWAFFPASPNYFSISACENRNERAAAAGVPIPPHISTCICFFNHKNPIVGATAVGGLFSPHISTCFRCFDSKIVPSEALVQVVFSRLISLPFFLFRSQKPYGGSWCCTRVYFTLDLKFFFGASCENRTVEAIAAGGPFPPHISTCFCCLDFKNRTVEAATAGLPHITTYSYGLIYDEI